MPFRVLCLGDATLTPRFGTHRGGCYSPLATPGHPIPLSLHQKRGSPIHQNSPPGSALPPPPRPPSPGFGAPPDPWEMYREQRRSSPCPSPCNRYRACSGLWRGRDTEVGKPLSPMHPSLGCTLGAAEPREPVQRVNPPARQVETWEGRAGWGSSPGWREQVAGCSLVDPGVRVLGTPHFTSPGGAVPQPGLRTGHETLGGGFGGLQDAAGEPGAAGGPATVQHLPPAAGGSGGRGRR